MFTELSHTIAWLLGILKKVIYPNGMQELYGHETDSG